MRNFALLIVGVVIGWNGNVYGQTSASGRVSTFEELAADFEVASTSYQKLELGANASLHEKIRHSESDPQWKFLPQFVALAEGNDDAATALRACRWIIDRSSPSHVNMLAAESAAWRVIASFQQEVEDLPLLCLKAAGDLSPAREEFLRGIASRNDLPEDRRAVAMLALAEYLSLRYSMVDGGPAEWPEPKTEEEKYYRRCVAPEWIAYASSSRRELEANRTESIELFREVLQKYADIPFTMTAPYFRDLQTVGDKARKSLHALENLHVGAPAPDFEAVDLNGRPLQLKHYRGKVVLLSFWFPTCGPCIAAVPHERQLLEKFSGQPFAILGVCRTDDASSAMRVAEEHGMNWPSIDDGKPGRVTDLYNIQSWPTLFLIDAEGTIVSKDIRRDKVEEMLALQIVKAAKKQ